MGVATYSSPAQRIGKIKGQILKHAIHVSTLEISGEVYKQPVKAGDTVIFRQVVPYGATTSAPNTFTATAAANLISEGTTPPSESITVLDTSVTVQKYGALYGYTERQASLGEDDVPSWMEEQLGERLGLVRELIYIGAVQGCTNRFYSGGTTRATVADTITLNMMDKVNRSLRGNHALFMRGVISAGLNYGTSAIPKSYICFTHTDAQRDIEAIPGYIGCADYANMKPIHELELGALKSGNVRFIVSPEMPIFADSGAAVGATGLKSTSASNIDVYQAFIVAKDAWGHTAFRGLDAFDYHHIPVKQVDKSDPTGERGYCSSTFYDAGVVTNNGWMAILEFGVTSL